MAVIYVLKLGRALLLEFIHRRSLTGEIVGASHCSQKG